jgi:signal transduction histidine kinase
MGVAIGGGIFAMSAVLLLARAIYFLFAPPLTDLFAPSRVNAAFFLACAFSIACCSIGWIQLTHERVQMDLKDAESSSARSNREVAEATELAHSMAQRAAAADAARRELLETVNHEIRNPLGGLVAATDLLLDANLTLEQQECALAVRAGAERLLQVHQELLVLSEIKAGRAMTELSAFDLRSVIEHAVKTYAHDAKRKQIDLKVAYPAEVSHLFRGDAARIRQVMMNLMGNAVRFTSSGQVLVAVACEGRGGHHAQVRVSVTYSGIRIPPERTGSEFEKPSQLLPWSSRIHGGSSMGLGVSREAIELMGGRLHVESQAGRGSKFWFTLLLLVEDAPQ